ncbi:MAG TPA: DUF2288 family protein [Polyangiales bacterium]|nr:DUF2288 family protein [Polyangiales bacterium]
MVARRDLRARPIAFTSARVEDLREKLRSEILPARWPDLLYQFARGGLLLARHDADLLTLAVELARDDRQAVEARLASGELRRCLDEDARTFQGNPAQRFQFVIVQPWVLAQALQQ